MLALLRLVLNGLLFAALTAGVGLGLTAVMTETGARPMTRTSGPWVEWVAAGRPDADPYARAHAARKGLLPISSAVEQSYRASTDSTGSALRAACDYAIMLNPMGGAWWAIAAYGSKGQLLPNAADRFGFNTHTVMRENDGRALIMLARDARAGNWLPIGGASQINVVLTVQPGAGPDKVVLPEIQRLDCR